MALNITSGKNIFQKKFQNFCKFRDNNKINYPEKMTLKENFVEIYLKKLWLFFAIGK